MTSPSPSSPKWAPRLYEYLARKPPSVTQASLPSHPGVCHGRAVAERNCVRGPLCHASPRIKTTKIRTSCGPARKSRHAHGYTRRRGKLVPCHHHSLQRASLQRHPGWRGPPPWTGECSAHWSLDGSLLAHQARQISRCPEAGNGSAAIVL